ncbi:MAG: SMC-Scp complex subunit ScpB [Ruminococcaceae bacterium]|nr:SMC-Scp complex subunit ScpB [Oscillospiraceae bacterium]
MIDRLSRNEALAEALLFAAGDSVKLSDIAIVLKLDKKDTEKVMDRLVKIYEERHGGIMLRKIADGYQFCSRPEFHEDFRDYFEKPRPNTLSRAAMETLSIIAYNQPITRNGIELVRGVNSDTVILRLIDKGLIYEAGRSENPGRPILYATTEQFLRAMGISDLSQLPPLETASEVKSHETVAEETENATLFSYTPSEEEISRHAEELDDLIEDVDGIVE